jgi:hypothetical protein
MDEEKPKEVPAAEEKKPEGAPIAEKPVEEKKSEEIQKELPRVPIAVPIILCPQCYKPMEITGKVDVEVEEKGFFKKGTKSIPHIEYRCSACGIEWRESLARKGAGCFIATATFGTPMAHEVNILKKFRDSFLLRNRTGKMLVFSYYKLSPPIARAIKKSEVMRRSVRILLIPIVNLFNLLYKKH